MVQPRVSADLFARLQAGVGRTYAIERELGGGAMGYLFLATESALGRRVVVKVLRSEFGVSRPARLHGRPREIAEASGF